MSDTHVQPWFNLSQYPAASNLDCSLGVSGWPDLTKLHTNGNLTFASGSLGATSVNSIYYTWVYVKGYQPWIKRLVLFGHA